jgi:type II secretory pathway component PulK
MWIVIVLASLVLMLAQAMRVEGGSSANIVAATQADAIEQGAIQYVLAHVDGLKGAIPLDTDMPCQGVRVGDGAFWIMCPNWDDDRTRAYGLVDEASKVNLNYAPPEVLAALPQMTSDLAAGIFDWRDATSQTPSPGGAKDQYYMLLPDPYHCKCDLLETVEELLLVKDFTRDILYGEDTNRNFVLDTNEDDADASDPPDNHDGHLDRGLYPFVTVYSREPITDSNGGRRVNVANGGGQALSTLLTKNLSLSRANEILGRATALARLRPFTSILDFYVRCQLTASEFAPIADFLTASTATTLRGLINVGTAPKEVLMCLPGLEESDATALVSARDSADLSNLAWVTQVLAPAKLTAIGPYITARAYRFSADIVSVAADGRAFRRCRIVVDAQTSPPKVIYRQDLTFLGWPLDPEILSALRAGVSIEEAAPIQTVVQGAH